MILTSTFLLFSKFLLITAYLRVEKREQYQKFPSYFKFGVATSSYQVEGGWNASGKTPSMWDYYTHTFPELIKHGANGDVACDSYHQIDIDIENLKFLNANFYRFSLNWPRILPNGGDTFINPDGVRYYNELIDKLIGNGIEPIITLYHWELPQFIQDLGGWTNVIVIRYFEEFARVAFRLFGDRVKTWVTINEPFSICGYSYEQQLLAPFINSKGIGSYLCGHNVILAHARAYHVYQNEFRANQKGEVGIVIEMPWYQAKSDNFRDRNAANRAADFHFNWFVNPIFSTKGNYPEVMRRRIDEYSQLQGFHHSRLPKFTNDEVDFIRGSADFLGLNHYGSVLITPAQKQSPDRSPSQENDAGVVFSIDPSWNKTAREAFTVNPPGLRSLLNYLKDTYGNPKIYIMENGYAGAENETTDDDPRVWYYQGYLKAVLDAILYDSCNVQAYTAWSFMDNFEWSDGYTLRFGLFYVDFNDPRRTRTPKKSAFYYRNVIRTRHV